MKVTLAKWSLYIEWRASSGHNTKKGRTKAYVITRQDSLGKNQKRTRRRVDRKKEENKHSHIRDSVAMM